MSHSPSADLPKSQMFRDMTALGLYNMKSATLVRNEMWAYQLGFQQLILMIEQLQNDWWPPTASETRLRQWETLLGLPLRPRATLDRRRQTVLELLRLGEGDRTPEGARRRLAAAGIRAQVEESCLDQRLTVTVEAFGEEYDSIYQCMDRARELLPAHMEVVFEFGGPDWGRWEELNPTWSAFDAAGLSWQERDTWKDAPEG